MANIGDLVAIAGLDSTEWVKGCIKIQQATGQTTSLVGQQFGSMGAAAGRNIAQMGFAAQDFTSVLAGGGKNALGRALMSTMNNVQMLGAIFGHWGMAVTAVGGALGAMLIPKLLEGGAAAKTFGESMKEALKHIEDLGKSEASFSGTMKGLGHIDSSKAMTERIADIDMDRGVAMVSRRRYEGELKRMVDEGIRSGILKRSAVNVNPFTGEAGGGSVISGGGAAGDEALASYREGLKALEAMTAEERRLKDIRFAAVSALPGLEEKERAMADAKLADEWKTARAKEREGETEEINKIKLASRSRADIGADRINRIAEFVDRGRLTEEQALKAAADATKDAAERRRGGANEASIGGTSAGFAALQESIREARDAPQVKLLQEANANLRSIITAVNARNNPPPAPVGIGG